MDQAPRRRPIRNVVILCLVGVFAVGCAERQTPSLSPDPSAVRSFDVHEVSRWVQFRQTFGLRTDLEWVLQVAQDSRSDNDFSVPLLPAEVDELANRYRSVEALAPPLDAYGKAFPAEYAGTFIDGWMVVIQFSDRVADHRAALIDALGPDAHVDVRQVRYSNRELDKLVKVVESDKDWFTSIGSEFVSAVPSVQDNAVSVRYMSKDPSREPAVLGHFGNPDWLALEWYGPPPWTGPLGTLRATVVDEAGHPIIDATCFPDSVELAATEWAFLPRSTGMDGICEFVDIPAVDYTLDVVTTNDQDETVKSTGRAQVPSGGVSKIKIVVGR